MIIKETLKMLKRTAVIALVTVGAVALADEPKADGLSANVPEAKDYQLVYDLDLTKVNREFNYDVDNSAKLAGKAFDRIAYFVELQPNEGDPQYLYVSMDAFTGDVTKIGVPTIASGSIFQQPIVNMNVVTNVKGIATGTGLKGNIEFWPTNYSQGNSAKVPGADEANFDFGDQPSTGSGDYGSMQVHNTDAKQTLFAVNHWVVGREADIGIGNAPSGNPDWTFSASSKKYKNMRLRVLVHVK